jgi:hypothetical protein
MIVLFFIIVLEISLIVHVYFMVNFISKKADRDFRGFFVTTVVNIFMAIFIALVIIVFPSQLREINLELILFLESGIIFIVMLYVKMKISIGIYRRSQDPANYHFNVFGKKVMHKNVTTPKDVMIYFMTLPVTMICGAYFVVKLGCL